MSAADAVEVRGVHKSFGSAGGAAGHRPGGPAGEVTVILGPSGSGKSTLLRTINHLEKVDRGLDPASTASWSATGARATSCTSCASAEILRQRTQIGFVFQNFNLFPHLTVLENVVEAPVSAQGRPREEVEPRRAAAAGPGRASPTRPTPTRGSCPAVSSSGWPSPGRWRCEPR